MTLYAPALGLGDYLIGLVDLPMLARRPRSCANVLTYITSPFAAPFLWRGFPAHSLLCLATTTATWTSLKATGMYWPTWQRDWKVLSGGFQTLHMATA